MPGPIFGGGGGSANVTLGASDDEIFEVLSPVGVLTIDPSIIVSLAAADASNAASTVLDFDGTTGAGFTIFNSLGPISFQGTFSGFQFVGTNLKTLPAPISGVSSYIVDETTDTTAFPALPTICPATFDLHGLTPTKIVSINWGSVTSFSGTTVNIDLSGQALTSAETSEAVQVAATAGAGNLATMTINVSGGTNGALLQPAGVTADPGGLLYVDGSTVFLDGIAVATLVCDGGGTITSVTATNLNNLFLPTDPLVITTDSPTGTGAVFSPGLGTNTYKAAIDGAGGTVTSN